MKLKYIALMITGLSLNSYAFDLEDYNTTRRATRDAFLLAQTNFAESKNAYDDYKNLLKVNCYLISDASTFSLANLDGLITGACNRDGQKSHAAGGVLPSSGTSKLGDKLARIIELMPAPVAMNINDIKIIGNLSSLDSTLRTQRDTDVTSRMASIDAATVTISAISGCAKTPNVINAWKSRGATNTTLIDKYKTLRTDLLTKAIALKRSTNEYIAAKNAYRGGTVVYLKSNSCTNGGAYTIRLRYDPFVPDWTKTTGLKTHN